MTLIREDDYGVYAKSDGSIIRPLEGIKHVIASYDLLDADISWAATYLIWHPDKVAWSSQFKAGDHANTHHLAGSPLHTVRDEAFDEVWLHDDLTRYGPDSWDYEPVAQALATARVNKRRRLGENIPNGSAFAYAHKQEMQRMLNNPEGDLLR